MGVSYRETQVRQPRNPLARIWHLLTGAGRSRSDAMGLAGSQFAGRSSARRKAVELGLPERPVRPIMGDYQVSEELLEMIVWGYEPRHGLDFIVRDAFQQIDGQVASWQVADTLADGTPVHPDVLAIARDIENRRYGKDLVLGGNRLQTMAFNALWAGDGFLSMGFEKEGISRNDWAIARTLDLPPLTIFVEPDEHGVTQAYRQQVSVTPRPDDTLISPVAMLHLQWGRMGGYGCPITLQSLEPWRKIKEAAADVEDAARNSAIAPWLHEMPENKDENYRKVYRQDIEARRQRGIITDLYLLNGADVRQAAISSDMDGVLENWRQLRYQLVVPGLPAWLFPGLGVEQSGAREIANQPALAYARMISGLRALIGEQIKWAITVEIVLKRGLDWFEENGSFEIEWPAWYVTGQETGLMQQDDETDREQSAGSGANDENDSGPDSSDSNDSAANRIINDAQRCLRYKQATDAPEMKALLRRSNWLMGQGVSDRAFHRLWQTNAQLRDGLAEIEGRSPQHEAANLNGAMHYHG